MVPGEAVGGESIGRLQQIRHARRISSGVTIGLSRSMTVPSRPTRNFSKFHVMSAPPVSPRSQLYSSHASGPLTSIFENIGNVTPNFDVTNSRISSSVPGSCAPNWLHGKASTVKPCSLYSSWSVRRPAYWPVRPQ